MDMPIESTSMERKRKVWLKTLQSHIQYLEALQKTVQQRGKELGKQLEINAQEGAQLGIQINDMKQLSTGLHVGAPIYIPPPARTSIPPHVLGQSAQKQHGRASSVTSSASTTRGSLPGSASPRAGASQPIDRNYHQQYSSGGHVIHGMRLSSDGFPSENKPELFPEGPGHLPPSSPYNDVHKPMPTGHADEESERASARAENTPAATGTSQAQNYHSPYVDDFDEAANSATTQPQPPVRPLDERIEAPRSSRRRTREESPNDSQTRGSRKKRQQRYY